MRLALITGFMIAVLIPLATIRTNPRDVIAGRVVEQETGAPIRGAEVSMDGLRGSALTDLNGRYTLTYPGSGVLGRDITITATAAGFTATSQRVVVTDTVLTVDFALARDTITVSEPEPADLRADRDRRSEQSAAVPVSASSEARLFRPAVQATLGFVSNDPGYNRESYAYISENTFVSAAIKPLSTFSIDVDRASYSNVRRFITSGGRPPVDAVRVEEMVNYFTYDYPAPDRGQPFSVTTEVGRAPWNTAHTLLRIGIQGQRIDLADLPPNNLVFLLDVSGSMQSPTKLPLLKQSFRLLVDELRSEDRVAIVVYAGAAGLVLPSTPGAEKVRILEAIDRLEAGGSTAGGAGIQLAYRVAREHHLPEGNNRVILATDGDFNVGASSDAEMVRLIESKREQGTFLTVLGFGTGNLQDSKMEQIADHGNGNFAYIDNLMEARKVLVQELGGTLFTIAKDVKIQVEFNPARVQAYRLVGYENRLLAAEDFNDDRKDAGELGAGHSVTALYEIVPVGVDSDVVIREVDSLRYQSNIGASRTSSGELGFVKLRYKTPTGTQSRLIEHVIEESDEPMSDDLTFAAAVAGFGMLLRDSEYCGSMTLDGVLALARESRGQDVQGYRQEFVQLVERTQRLRLLDK